MHFLKSKTYWPILIAIFILGAFLRFYHLGQSPPGFYVDEAAIGYNAYCVLNTGKDEYGKAFPIFFRSFGDYKMPLYIYSSVLPIKLMGLSVFSTRFISALSGSLTILLVFFLTKALFPQKDNSLSWLASLVFAFSPLPVFFSRMGLEASLALFWLLLALLLQIKSFAGKNFLLLVLAVFSYAFSGYSYHTERFLAPAVLLLTSSVLWWKFRLVWKNSLLKTAASLLIFLILFLPQVFLFNSTAGQARIKSLGNRENSLRNRFSLYSAYFSPRSLFFDPDPDLQRSLPALSVFYPWMCLPLAVGLYWLFKEKRREAGGKIILLLLFLSPVPASLARDPFSSFRAYPLVFPLVMVISLGIQKLLSLWGKRFWFLALALAIVSLSLADLWRNNFILLPNERFGDWSYGYSALAEELKKGSDEKVMIDDPIGTSYVEILFFLRYPPVKFQKEQLAADLKNYYQIQNWPGTLAWDRFTIGALNWKRDIYTDQLIVAKPLAISESQAKEHFLTKAFAIIGPDGATIFNGYLTHPDLKRQDDERKARLKKYESGNF